MTMPGPLLLAVRTTSARLLDEDFGIASGRYHLTMIVALCGQTARITVCRDPYEFQSYAHLDILTPANTWLRLLAGSPSGWWPDTSPTAKTRSQLEPVAASLLLRAHTVLAARTA
jgi:hypothetical protein